MTTDMTKTPIYVDTLPKSIKTATGTIINPSLETCRQHGYDYWKGVFTPYHLMFSRKIGNTICQSAEYNYNQIITYTEVLGEQTAGVLYEDHYVAFTHQASTNPAVINIEYAAKLPDGTVYRQTSSTITNSYPDIVQVTLQSGTYDCYWFRCQVPDFFARPEYIRDWNGEALFGSPVGSDRGFDLTGVLVIDDGDDVWLGASGEFDLGGGEVHSFTNGIDVTQVILENGGAEL